MTAFPLSKKVLNETSRRPFFRRRIFTFYVRMTVPQRAHSRLPHSGGNVYHKPIVSGCTTGWGFVTPCEGPISGFEHLIDPVAVAVDPFLLYLPMVDRHIGSRCVRKPTTVEDQRRADFGPQPSGRPALILPPLAMLNFKVALWYTFCNMLSGHEYSVERGGCRSATSPFCTTRTAEKRTTSISFVTRLRNLSSLAESLVES